MRANKEAVQANKEALAKVEEVIAIRSNNVLELNKKIAKNTAHLKRVNDALAEFGDSGHVV